MATNISITLQLDGLDQVEAIAAALETHIELEGERKRDGKNAGWDASCEVRLAAAKRVYAALTGRK